MAAITGQLTSYNQTVGVKVDMDPLVSILPVDEVPFTQWLPQGPAAESTKVEWLNEALTGQVATTTTTTVAGVTAIVIDDTTPFRVGDVLAHNLSNNADGGVQVLVTAIPDAVTLTVTRPFAGSTDETITSGDTLALIGQYLDEGGNPGNGRSVDRTTDYNLTQITQEKVEASRTTRKVARFGMEDPYNHEVEKKFRELAIRGERRYVLGRRLQGAAGDAKKRTMGGVLYYIGGSSNSVSNTKANLEVALNSMLQNIWNAGSRVDTLWVSANIQNVFNTLNANRTRVTNDEGNFRDVVNTYTSSYGVLAVRFSRYIPQRKAIAVNQEFASKRDIDGYFHELLAKTGDAQVGEIVAEKSLEVKNGSTGHGVLTLTDA